MALLVVELTLQLGGFAYKSLQNHTNKLEPGSSSEFVILCLGESTTAWGLGESYPAQLQQILDEKSGPGKYKVINEGVTSTNTLKISQALEENLKKYQPKMVLLMMGINDFWSLADTHSIFESSKLFKFFRLIAINSISLVNQAEKPKSPSEIEQPPKEIKNIQIYETTKKYSELYLQGQEFSKNKNFTLALKKYIEASNQSKIDPQIYKSIVLTLLELGQFKETEIYFNIIKKNYPNADVYSSIGETFYNHFGVFHKYGQEQARKYFLEALKIDPNSSTALTLLGCSYFNFDHQIDESLSLLEHGYKIGIRNSALIGTLSDIYIKKNEHSLAEQILQSNLQDFSTWSRLLVLYRNQKKHAEFESTLKKALEQFPNNQALLNFKSNSSTSSLLSKIQSLFITKYDTQNFLEFPPTQKNYIQIVEKLTQMGITVVAVQYPNRRSDKLKEFLHGQKVIFVENFENFKSASNNRTYEELFIDHFGGDFGHFTALGSKMISEEVFRVLKEANALPY